jgi:hypothetical protein
MATSGREKGFEGHPKGRPFEGGERGGLHMAERKPKGVTHGGGLHMATAAKHIGKATNPPKGGMPGPKKAVHAAARHGSNAKSDGGMRHGTTKATGQMASRFDRMAKESSRYTPGKGHR